MKNTLFLATLCLGLPMVGTEAPAAPVQVVTLDGEAVGEITAADEEADEADDSTAAADEEDYDEADADYEEEDYEEEADIVYTEEQKADALAKLKDDAEQSINTVRGINSRETADAAAATLNAAQKTLREITPVLRSLDQDEVMTIVFKARAQMNLEIQRLEKENFYGSEALALEITGNASMARPALPLTDELKAEFINMDGKATPPPPVVVLEEGEDGSVHIVEQGDDEDEEEELNVSGGPGFTQETAWVLEASDNEKLKGRPAEDYISFIDAKLNLEAIADNGYNFDNPQLETVYANGKVYCHLTADLLPEKEGADRYSFEQWLDITAYSVFTSQEEATKHAEEGMQLLTDSMKLLLTVKDKASADAAAEQLSAIAAKITPKHAAAMQALSTEQKIALAEKNGIDPMGDAERISKVVSEKFYGSDKLKAAMDELEEKM